MRDVTKRRVLVLAVVVLVVAVIALGLVGRSRANHAKAAKYYECLREEGRDPHAQLPLLDNARIFCGGLFGYATGNEPGPEP
jgi:hypothetical protein